MKTRHSKPTVFASENAHGAASKFGQMIGEAFASQVVRFIQAYLSRSYPTHMLLEPEVGRALVKLEMMGGTFRQMDNVIVQRGSTDPIALFESKWLKDARHHNDKGAWILQLREMRKKYPTVRGAVANLAGYWTEGVGVMFQSEGGIISILVATDQEIYDTLQPHIDTWMQAAGLPTVRMDAMLIRGRLPRASDLANCLQDLQMSGILQQVANTWLTFQRGNKPDGTSLLGHDLIARAIDNLLRPLPSQPQINRCELILHIETGNLIHHAFSTPEEAIAFLQQVTADPARILDYITPKRDSTLKPE